jgi:transketolase
MPDSSLDERCINALRFLTADAVEEAESGHPGMPLGAAPMAYVLWDRFLTHDPENPDWPDRDRFVLSAGHGSALLYTLLHLCGYDLPLKELRKLPPAAQQDAPGGGRHLPGRPDGPQPGDYFLLQSGRNIHFGVREHAMCAVTNGIALHGGCCRSTPPSSPFPTTCARPSASRR